MLTTSRLVDELDYRLFSSAVCATRTQERGGTNAALLGTFRIQPQAMVEVSGIRTFRIFRIRDEGCAVKAPPAGAHLCIGYSLVVWTISMLVIRFLETKRIGTMRASTDRSRNNVGTVHVRRQLIRHPCVTSPNLYTFSPVVIQNLQAIDLRTTKKQLRLTAMISRGMCCLERVFRTTFENNIWAFLSGTLHAANSIIG